MKLSPDPKLSLRTIKFVIGWLTSKKSKFDIFGFTILIEKEASSPPSIFIIFVDASYMLSMTKMNKRNNFL